MSEFPHVQALGAVRRRDGGPIVGDPVAPSDELLVFDGDDDGERFHHFLGGTVEFGEHSREAVGEEFVVAGLVGTFERVFEFQGETGHEVWRVYEGHLEADWPYDRETFTYEEDVPDGEMTARWVSVAELRSPETTFYSRPVLDALKARCADGD